MQAQHQQTVVIPLPTLLDTVTTDETWLTLEFRLNKTTPWAEEGHLVAIHQQNLGSHSSLGIPSRLSEKFSHTEDKKYINIQSTNSRLKFDKTHARIESWTVGTSEIIIPGTNSLTCWRPLIDNDTIDGPYWASFGLNNLQMFVVCL
jgi:beta-galactosidase/beta-glucuronidase